MKRAILPLFSFFIVLGFLLGTSAIPGAFSHAVVYADDPPVGTGACSFVTDKKTECEDCFNNGGAWTAVGCLGKSKNDGGASTLNDFLQSFLNIGIGMGGGIAFLLILFSGFQTITSAGNPEKLHAAKELMTAAITGLLLIIFSVFLLKLIGVDILQLPGFGSGGGQSGAPFK